MSAPAGEPRVRAEPQLPPGVRIVAERPDGNGLHVHPEWEMALPGTIQGVTGSDGDMSLFGGARTGDVIPRWQALRDRLGCRTIVHSRQIHGEGVLLHDELPEGLLIGPDADGHATDLPDILLAVSIADCVPIFLAAPDAGAIALLHGGWRGVAAGILENGMSVLNSAFDADAAEIHVHLGPAICGECFEVGPEVPVGLGMRELDAAHVDLRALLAGRAIEAGVDPARITVSAFCTRHGDSPFYSHRGGCAERQIAVLGVHPL